MRLRQALNVHQSMTPIVMATFLSKSAAVSFSEVDSL